MFPLWLLGCIISLAGSVGAIVGTTIQKLSFRHNDALPHASRRVYWKQRRWLMGLGLVVIGGFTDFASLSMTPASTIAALGSVPLAANVPLAHYWLHEPVTKRDLVGTALIVLGSTLSVVFGDHSDKTYTSDDLQDLYKKIAYIIYGCCLLGCMALCWVAVRYLTPLRVKLVESIDAYRVAEAEDQLDEAELEARRAEEEAQWCVVSPDDVVAAVHANLAPPGLLAQEAVLLQPALESAPNAAAAPEASDIALLLHPPRSQSRSSTAGAAGGAGAEVAASSRSCDNSTNTPSLGPSTSPLNLTLDSMSFEESQGEIGASSSVRGAQRASTSVLSARAAVLDLEISYAPYRRVHPVFFCALSGIFGAQSLLFGKSVASLLATSMTKGDNQFAQPLTYAFIVALGACLLGQLHFFATALEFFDALFVVPVFKCFYLTLSTVGGALYFREVQNFDARQWIFFPLGLAMNIVGVWVLSSRDMKLDQADPLDKQVDAAVSGSGGEDELLASIHEQSLGATVAFESMRPSASFKNKAGSLLGRSSLEDINIAPQDEIEQAEQQALLTNASENLLRNAVEIANEEAALSSNTHDRVLLVTSPMAGVTLVASEMVGASPGPQGTVSPPPSLSRQPTQPLAGSTRAAANGNDSALRTSSSWVSPEPLLAASHLPSDEVAPTLPRSASNVDPHGMLSPGSIYGGSMGVSMFSLPQHGNSHLARSARSPVAASATPYDRRNNLLSPDMAMSYGSLARTRSEQSSHLQPPVGSLSRASSVTTHSVNLPPSASSVGRRSSSNLPPRVSASGSRRRSNGGSAAPPDILVQRGSLIYRQPSFTGQTPLDSSRMTPGGTHGGSRTTASSDDNAADAASGPCWADSVPLFLTPTQASSFTVASPITNETYSMPRDHSIFAHTRGYLARLGSATGLLRGKTPTAAAASNSLSPRQPNPYTAPNVRPPPANAAAVHAARGLPFSAGARAVSGGDSYRPNSSAGLAEEEQAWRDAREHIASAARRSAALDVSADGGAGAPAASVATSSYVPPSFLRQPLAQLMPQQPRHDDAPPQTEQQQPPAL